MPKPLSLAIVGTGLIVTRKHWPAMAVLDPRIRVTALVNRTLAKAEVLADAIHAHTQVRPTTYSDYRVMLAAQRPEAVLLALPPEIAPEVAQAALAAGCHVITEKPLAADLPTARGMLGWPERFGRILMVAENHRYLSSYLRAAALIADGRIGPLRTVRWSLYAFRSPDSPYYNTTWRLHPAHPGGYLSDVGVHHAAALRMLVGDVAELCAYVALGRADLSPADTVSASLRFAGGALGAYSVAYGVTGPETPIEITGDTGTLLVWHDRVALWRGGNIQRQWEEPSAIDGMVTMYADFLASIRSGQAVRSTVAEAYADLQVIVALLHSNELRRSVAVADLHS